MTFVEQMKLLSRTADEHLVGIEFLKKGEYAAGSAVIMKTLPTIVLVLMEVASDNETLRRRVASLKTSLFLNTFAILVLGVAMIV